MQRIALGWRAGALFCFCLSACGGSPEGTGSPAGGAAPQAQTTVAADPMGSHTLDRMLAQMTPPDPGFPVSYDLASTPCGQPDRSNYVVPADFAVTYLIGPAHGDWGEPRRLHLSADGRYSVTQLVPPTVGSLASPGERVVREGRIDVPAVRNVYAAVLVCDFFGLDGNFYDPSQLVGSTDPVRAESVQVLAVTANGRDHAIAVRNIQVPRFLTVRTTLFSETGGMP